MQTIRFLALTLVTLFSSWVSAAELNVYWTTDGIDPERLKPMARTFSKALQRELGMRANVNVATIAETSRAFIENKVDLLITCNEVNTRHGVPLETLSREIVDSLDCRGGSRDEQWVLGLDQGVNRKETGEIWVYFVRGSSQFRRVREVRAAIEAVREGFEVEPLITAGL